MARENDDGDGEERPDGSAEPRECMACRGSGKVISNLGGTPKDTACPWCGGEGVRLADADAQASWPANEAPAPQETVELAK